MVKKAVTTIGYFGGLRVDELTALTFKDVVITGESIEIFVPESKTDPHGKNNFHFLVPKDKELNVCPYSVVKSYFDAIAVKWKIIPKFHF